MPILRSSEIESTARSATMDRSKISIILFLVPLALGLLSGGSTSADSSQAETATLSAPPAAAVGSGSAAPSHDASSVPTVALRSASGATIGFKTQNGEMVDGIPSETWDVPHLVLRRNGALADPGERTLIMEVMGIEVPPAGMTITLNIETQHGDPDLYGDSPPRIPVWRESRGIANATGVTQTAASVVFALEFDETVTSDTDTIATPTDYFRYDLLVTDAQHPATSPLHASSHDYAFLLENQWIVPLPEVQETSPGAAPDELMVYYCDMFPFRTDNHDVATWLPRERVPDYLRVELIPAMVEAYRVQTADWGFPWYQEWTGYRPGEDEERLSVALADGETWFHGKAPGQGNSGISINVSRGKIEYDTLTDGLMSTFHHELFHNHQRNLHQHLGGSGGVGGVDSAWDFFAEGTAVLASSVGQPDVQFSQTWGSRAYLANARGFVGREGISGGDLNKSYERMNAYHAAAYWRFLYEQCGGMTDGVEDPAAGMRVIRQVLMTLYAGDTVDIDTSTDLVENLPGIMDQALKGSSCPFKTHQESLLAFARAIYALQMDGGRCVEPGFPTGCGFYDPENLYHNPAVSTITYRGEQIAYSAADQPYPTGIPNSFGIDLVEVALDATANGEPLTIEVYSAPGSDARFNVQLWKRTGQPIAAQIADLQTVQRTGSDGRPVYVIPEIDMAEHNRLGLIITRVDAAERMDREGAYTLVLRPDALDHTRDL
jgi:hypothetical protein